MNELYHDPRMAAEWARHAADSAYNAHDDRPAVLDLLGDVRGRRVLDAACGAGLYLEELIRRGATVTAFDSSDQMVRLARDRVGDGVEISLGRPAAGVRDQPPLDHRSDARLRGAAEAGGDTIGILSLLERPWGNRCG